MNGAMQGASKRVYLGLALLLWAGMVHAAVLSGPQFAVNSFTSSYAYTAAVCCADDGNFVVVWVESIGPFGTSADVLGQRFDFLGDPRGTEFLVNSYTTNQQFLPDVSCDPAGAFVVVWSSWYQVPASSLDVFGQRFSSSGNRRGDEFQVNTGAYHAYPGFQYDPSVCCLPSGEFVVSWTSQYYMPPVEPGRLLTSIDARSFDSAGVPVTPTEFMVSDLLPPGPGPFPVPLQYSSDICCDEDGSFVVVWSVLYLSSPEDILGTRYDSTGSTSGIFLVNTYTTGYQCCHAIWCRRETTRKLDLWPIEMWKCRLAMASRYTSRH